MAARDLIHSMLNRNGRFSETYGPWAVVAGGSEGIGAAFGSELARRGCNLVLIAEREQPLLAVADQLAQRFPVQVRPYVVDLADVDAQAQLSQRLADVDVGLGIYNAAFSEVTLFNEQSLQSKLRTLDVNARGALIFCDWLAPRLSRRGRGGLLLMSSLAALQGTPRVASYAATKAFDLVLAESLWHELRRDGVDVLAACAGATRTPGYEKTKPKHAGVLSPPIMEPEDVAKEALDALGSGPSYVVGRSNRMVVSLLSRVLGRRRAVETLGRSMDEQYR